jgi:outer membrane protein TolC
MLARFFWIAVSLATCLSLPAFAQTGPPPAPRQALDLQAPPSGGSVSLTLEEAVAMALARNPSLEVERIRVQIAREEIGAERGRFDPMLNISQSAFRRDNIIASRFYPTGLYVDREQASRVSLESKNTLGGALTAGADFRRLFSTSNIQTLSPQYSANLVFGVTQPLLRDFGHSVSTARIRVAAQQVGIAEHTLAQQVARLIRQTEEEYWRWAFAREQADTRRRSLDAAVRFVTQAESLFGAGKVARASVLQARAALAQREDDAIAAATESARVEDRLRLLLQVDFAVALTAADGVEALVQPVRADLPLPPAIVKAATVTTGRLGAGLDAAASVTSALQRRPELLVLQRESEQREIELRLASNQRLPRLDLTAQYTTNGMSGRPSTVCVDPTSIECVAAGSGVPDSVFAARTQPGQAFGSLFSDYPFDGWSAELRLQVPLGNRTARAQHAEAALRLTEARLRLQAARDEIVRDVRDAVREAAAAQARLDAARQTATFAQTQFVAARTQFDAGLSSTFDVLRVQDELDRAKITELRALADLNVALGRVRLADMTILDDYNIELAAPGRAVATQ